MTMNGEFNNYFYVEEFIIYNKYCKTIILFLISLDLHKHHADKLHPCTDKRFVEIESLQVEYNDSKFGNVEYKATFGRGYRLPSIIYNQQT